LPDRAVMRVASMSIMPICRLCRSAGNDPGHGCARAAADGIIARSGSEVFEEFQ
jgi:hypothetical protein